MADFNNISTISTLEAAGNSAFSSVTFSSDSPTIVSESLNGRKQYKTLRDQHYGFRAVFVPMTSQDFKPIYAFLAKQRGQFNSFTINLPVSHDGTITTGTATGSAGSTSITVSGTGTLKAGDFIGFNDSGNDHEKAYMVADDATISGSGTVTIVPGLKKAVSGATFYTGTNVDFHVRLTQDVQTYQSRADGYYRHEVTLEEAH